MRVLRLRGFLAGGLVFVALTRSGAAEAQEKGRVQLSLQTTLFGYSHDETQPDSSSGAEAYESSSWRAGLEGPGLVRVWVTNGATGWSGFALPSPRIM